MTWYGPCICLKHINVLPGRIGLSTLHTKTIKERHTVLDTPHWVLKSTDNMCISLIHFQGDVNGLKL